MNDGGDIPKFSSGFQPKIGFEQTKQPEPGDGGILVAGKTGDLSRREVKVSGIESLEVPESWSQTTEGYLGRGSVSTFSPGDGSDLVLSALDKGVRLSEAQANSFDAVLALADPNGRPKILLPSQIKGITNVLGKTGVGDNQYSNATKSPDPSAPVFKVLSAQVITVEAKPVVEVEGQFVDQNGQRIKDFIGVFGKGDGGKVNQLFLQTSSKSQYITGRPIYKDALKSIRWQ